MGGWGKASSVESYCISWPYKAMLTVQRWSDARVDKYNAESPKQDRKRFNCQGRRNTLPIWVWLIYGVGVGGGGREEGKKGRVGLWLCLESCAEPGARTTELHHPLLDLVHLGLGQSWQAILKHFQHTNKEYKSTTNKWRIYRKERNFFPSKILAKIICYQCFGLCGSGIPKMSLWIRIQVKSRL